MEYLHRRGVVEDGFVKFSEPPGSVENHIMSLEMDERNLKGEEVPGSHIMVQMIRSSHHYSLRSKNRGGATLLHMQKGSITLSFEDDGFKRGPQRLWSRILGHEIWSEETFHKSKNK